MAGPRPVLNHITHDYRRYWKQLALTDIIYKIITFVLLTPLVSILFRVSVALCGETLLTDYDILFFFLGPVGWLCFITAGGLWLGIVALEQAALMAVIPASQSHERIHIIAVLRFAMANAWPVIQVTARMVALTLLTIAPFLAVVGMAYFILFVRNDQGIDYYLQEKPSDFLVILGIGGILSPVLVAVLLHLFTGWLFALPLVLFEKVRPSDALRQSSARARGHRRKLLLWIVGWALASTVLTAVATSIVIWLAQFFVPRVTASLVLLFFAIGLTLLVWIAVNLAINMLSITSFATILFNLYRYFACKGDMNLSWLGVSRPASNKTRFQLTRSRLLVAGIVSVLVATTVGVLAMQSVCIEDDVAIIAHRGSSKAAPENTIAAVRKAIEDRADWIEIDVQETADGQVIVFHDKDFKRVASMDLNIRDATMADLRDIDIGSWFAPEFKDERVPTLSEVLQECKGNIGVNIELKHYGRARQLEQRVANIVEVHDMASDIVIMSLNKDALQRMRIIRPDWTVGLLMSVSAGNLKKINADFLAVNGSFINRNLIRSAHKSGKEVYVWTVNDAPTMSNLIGHGIDGLITDKPLLARLVLEQRAEMSVPERLLLELATILGVRSKINPSIDDA